LRRRQSFHVVTAILGGGQGSRLWPLTRYRAKPAVPLAGRFRLIDIPISNALHAGLDHIYVLTQFNSASLHRHITQTYRFDLFSRGFVNILAAEQTVGNREWYQGTADAVRQNLPRLTHSGPSEIVVLSGDQLYLMELGEFVRRHRDQKAGVSIAVKPVPREEAPSFGIMRVDEKGWIREFVEKPEDPEVLDAFTPSAETFERMGLHAEPGSLLASMGIYVFDSGVLKALLEDTDTIDFGREVIPQAIQHEKVLAFPYDGFWEDIGTIPAFHQANLELTRPLPSLNLYDPRRPIYTHPRFLPGTKVNRCEVEQSVLCEGSILSAATVRHSIIGIRAVVRHGSVVEDSMIMGASEYEPGGPPAHDVHMGIGENCVIRRAIIDLNARIGNGAQLVNAEGVDAAEEDNYSIQGGIIVVPRDAVIPAGTVI
jgi:glucose-1-phosphate adenylyltransferase